jgi:hypothetical protein
MAMYGGVGLERSGVGSGMPINQNTRVMEQVRVESGCACTFEVESAERRRGGDVEM